MGHSYKLRMPTSSLAQQIAMGAIRKRSGVNLERLANDVHRANLNPAERLAILRALHRIHNAGFNRQPPAWRWPFRINTTRVPSDAVH